jgi:hypothetical protein
VRATVRRTLTAAVVLGQRTPAVMVRPFGRLGAGAGRRARGLDEPRILEIEFGAIIQVQLTTLLRQAFRRARPASPSDSQESIREELIISVERIRENQRCLDVVQPVRPKPLRGHPPARRLADNAGGLQDSHRSIAKSRIVPAGMAAGECRCQHPPDQDSKLLHPPTSEDS